MQAESPTIPRAHLAAVPQAAQPAGASTPAIAMASLHVPMRDAATHDAEMDYATIVRDLDVATTVIVPAGVSFNTELKTEGKAAVVVFGVIKGEVDAGDKSVIVMPGGAVDGPIRSSREVLVAGSVGRDESAEAVVTQGLFVLAAGGSVRGDVRYRSLRVHDGGTISGRLVPAQGQ